MNKKPAFIQGKIIKKEYDGISDDLLTGGLGKTGLEGPPPAFKNMNSEALRTLVLYYGYRGLMDMTKGGGYGVLFGPNVGVDGSPGSGEGMIAGREYLAYSDDGTGKKNVAMMVQVPESFDAENPCIVTGPSSGSRGVYGAAAPVGEWALKRGFAVAYTDKGTGNGMHDLGAGRVNLITGVEEDAAQAGKLSSFTADCDEEYLRKNPYEIAFKHAHSGRNPEKDWGLYVLQSIKFAFYVLNLEENFGKLDRKGKPAQLLTPENTIVIAAGISNGGDAALRAAEQDTEGLIRGVAVSEPNIKPANHPSVTVRQGEAVWKGADLCKNLIEYQTLLGIYQPCANLSPGIRDEAPMNSLEEEYCVNRLKALAGLGLLKKGSVQNQAREAREIINDFGILKEQNLLQPSHYFFQVCEAISVTYTNAYGGFTHKDKLAGFSFAAVDPKTKAPAPLPEKRRELVFAESAGLPPTCGIEIINNNSSGGPVATRESVSKKGLKDMNLKGALTLRRLATGLDESGNPLSGEEKEQSRRIRDGISRVRASGNLNGLPTVIVHGRNDAILPVNFTSRAYAALNSLVERKPGNLRYYEVTNAHHLDMLNTFGGFDFRFIPLHRYFIQALDMMYSHLKNKTPLPPSQVVRTIPRGFGAQGEVADISHANVPPIMEKPLEVNKILMEKGTVTIPA